MDKKEHILSEIRRIAEQQGGKAPGKTLFERETGIRESEWYGKIWALWNDAISEAGLETNAQQAKFPSEFVLAKYAEVCRHFGAVPSSAQLRMYARETPDFPSHNTFTKHFGSKNGLIGAVRDWAIENAGNADLLQILPEPSHRSDPDEQEGSAQQKNDGYVYLLKSGNHYKIGRSAEIEKRIKQISISLPEKVDLVHVIKTDDQPGIEAYWHRRFADKRVQGEWFTLSPADVRAFKSRKFM